MEQIKGRAFVALLVAIAIQAGTAAAAEGYVTIAPSLNVISIRAGDADKRNIYGAATPESSLFKKETDDDIVAGVNIGAGVFLGPRWQLGAGYEYVGQAEYESRGALGYDSGAGMDYSDGYFTQRIGKFDFHNIHLQTRYTFLETCKLNLFATAKAGVSFVHAKMQADVYGNNGAGPMVYEYTQFQTSKTKAVFSYGIGAGVHYNFTERVSGELSGEFFQTMRARFSDYSGKVGAYGGKISIGLGVTF